MNQRRFSAGGATGFLGCSLDGEFMDFSMIQNVSAAALRSKAKTYPVPGIPESERLVMPPPRSSHLTSPERINSSARPAAPQLDTLTAATAATTSIQKQQGLLTYARLMQLARENRFRTRFDLLL